MNLNDDILTVRGESFYNTFRKVQKFIRIYRIATEILYLHGIY